MYLCSSGIINCKTEYRESLSHFNYAEFEKFSVLELPYQTGRPHEYGTYKGPQFSMYIFLPHEVDGLPEMLREFSGLNSNLTEALSQTLGVLKRVTMKEMAIPKWKSSNKLKPVRTLEKLGLTLPFEMKGDFTGMLAGSDGELVYISEVIQSAYIDVDENGTEAGVVSAVLPGIGASRCSAEEEFVADHPFVFMIVERGSKAVIFAGAVFNPLDEDEDEDED
ncbi:At2g26390 [Linum perenne]